MLNPSKFDIFDVQKEKSLFEMVTGQKPPKKTNFGVTPNEKNGVNLMEIENGDLTLSELKRKLEIAKEGKEDDYLIDLIKRDIRLREAK